MHVFDHSELEKYLAAHIVGFDRLDQFEKFTDGQSNPTYKLTSAGRQFVLRAKPPGELMKSAHQVDREFRVMQALAKTEVPVPKMLHLSGECTPLGPMFFVMEMVEGRIYWDPALPELSKSDRSGVYDEMNAVLAALHSIEPDAVGLSDFGKPGNYYERQLARWSKQYRAAETEVLTDADWLIGWLNDHIVADDGASSIVHGDYRIDNIIFAQRRTKVIALLDW
ncbi:MAG: phosphotransferase family protein, partial [Paracoccaceae bacterium]